MPERAKSIQTKARSLIYRECANYCSESNGIKNHCLAREKSNAGVCVFFSDLEKPQCRYFQETVLPLDKELKGIFSNETLTLEIRDGRKRMSRQKCERCPETFLAKSNAQRFCPDCQKWNENEKTRTRMANLRKKANVLSLVTV